MGDGARAAALVGLAGLFAVISRRTATAGPGVTDLVPVSSLLPGASLNLDGSYEADAEAIRALARQQRQAHGLVADEDIIVRIAWIESTFNPSAVRYEPHIGDSSVGLMQTLTGTARWLASDMGYRAKGVPDQADLLEPETSLYFGAAYLDWLWRAYSWAKDSEEAWVRAYNGGPGGYNREWTAAYWRKYQDAKRRWG